MANDGRSDAAASIAPLTEPFLYQLPGLTGQVAFVVVFVCILITVVSGDGGAPSSMALWYRFLPGRF
jgi:hypothetical protein